MYILIYKQTEEAIYTTLFAGELCVQSTHGDWAMGLFSFWYDRVTFIDVCGTEVLLWDRLKNDKLVRGELMLACVMPLSVFVRNV